MTLKDTKRHIMTLCDGVCVGVLYVEIKTDNHEGDELLKSSVIISPSYRL